MSMRLSPAPIENLLWLLLCFFGIVSCMLWPPVLLRCSEALGSTDPAAYAFINEALYFLGQPAAKDPAAVLEMCLRLGGANLGVMKMLSEGHTKR